MHGSAPDIAGENLANPIAMILTSAMMLKYSLNLDEAAREIEEAVERVLEKGFRTGDIFEEGMTKIGCREMGEEIAKELREHKDTPLL